MLGMVVHPDDWRMFTDVPGDNSQPIWRSQVQCTDLDMDITQCIADSMEDHSCDHSMDVSVRCHKPTWSGTILFLVNKTLGFYIFEELYSTNKTMIMQYLIFRRTIIGHCTAQYFRLRNNNGHWSNGPHSNFVCASYSH